MFLEKAYISLLIFYFDRSNKVSLNAHSPSFTAVTKHENCSWQSGHEVNTSCKWVFPMTNLDIFFFLFMTWVFLILTYIVLQYVTFFPAPYDYNSYFVSFWKGKLCSTMQSCCLFFLTCTLQLPLLWGSYFNQTVLQLN